MGINIISLAAGLFCFISRTKYFDMKKCLGYVLYKIQSVINLYFIATLILKEEKNNYIMIVILFIVTIGTVVFTIWFTLSRIAKADVYHNRNMETAIAASAGGATGLYGRGFDFYEMCMVCCVMCMLYNASSAVHYLIKSYCYYLQEKSRVDSVISREEILLVGMQRCNTCQKAVWWLEENKILYTFRDIEKKKVGFYEIRNWHEKSGLPIESFFDVNVSSYKKMRLEKKLPKMTLEEQYELLASKNILLKSPILVSDNCICVGFKETEWSEHKDKIKK